MKESPVKIDVLLEPLLMEADDERADQRLLQIITDHAEQVIRGIIRYKLRLTSSQAAQQAEADDIYQDVVMQLVAQVQQFRRLPEAHPIADIRGIAAVIAHRTCSRWMRRQFPERHALKNRIHYLLTRQRGLALWQDDDGQLIAGFAAWQGQRRVTNGARVEKFSENQQIQSHIRTLRSGKQQELAAALAAIFNQVGRPIEFDEVVSTIATLLGIRDQPIESLADAEEGAYEPASQQPDPAWQIEKRMFLQRLWEELRQLPVNQRAALLLNLKDSSGQGCITLFPATGVATFRELAATLEITLEAFAQLWNELPLEDSRIAELLGLTRQQVINARKSGRERLARRLRGFF